MNYVYVVERWFDEFKEWRPISYPNTSDLEEAGGFLSILEEALPHRELRLAQYTVTEEVHVSERYI